MRQQRERGRTTEASEYVRQGWREDRCGQCNGSGLRPGAEYHSIINRCPACSGMGATWISPQGRRCVSPGGRFLGR